MTAVIDIYSFANLDRSARVRWACAEAGIPVREQRLDFMVGQHKSAEFRKINPFGIVPGVQIGTTAMFDSVGILLHLVETHSKAAALAVPVGDAARPQFLSWLMWAATSLDAPATELFFSTAFLKDADKQKAAMAKLVPVLDDLQAQLKGKRFALGNQFTLIDIVMGHTLSLVDRCDALQGHPGLKSYILGLASRPAAAATEVFTCQLQAA